MKIKKRLAAVSVLLVLGTTATFAQSSDEDHKASIRGIEIGMDAQQVLDRLGRMPDGRKDEKDDVLLFWKVEEGNILQVTFRKEHVSHLGLQYAHARPVNELWLQPLYSAPGGDLTARDPRLRIDYLATETADKLRSVWTLEQKSKPGYRVEIQFLSASRKKLGDRFADFVEFKYVTVSKTDLKKFDEVYKDAGKE